MQNIFLPKQRAVLSVAILGLLASGAANAGGTPPSSTPVASQGYSWTIPDTTLNTQNGYTGVLGVTGAFTGINDSGVITGDFVYKSAATTIAGLTNSHYYGFVGSSEVAVTNTTSGPLYAPGLGNNYYGNNGVTGVNNNGYATYSSATGSLLSGAGANFSSGETIIHDTNTLASGSIASTYAQGLDNTLVVGSNSVSGGTVSYDGFIYNIGSSSYTDYNYGGTVSGSLAQTSFTGVQTDSSNGDTYVTGNFTDTAGTHGLIYDVTSNTWTAVNDPNATGGTYVTGLNASGEAVGYYVDGTGDHGFTYNYVTDSFINNDINNPNSAANTIITGVNDAGTLVGAYTVSGGSPIGFVATADSTVPEPEQLSLLMLGLLPMLGFSRRQQKPAVAA
ncbi:MAG: PEP-CTERM sorting domain-containing protein [Methylococcales bacterium]|nr:PEP-CTERM sorting domain-containing protein [Methylococcales bacterium]